MKLSATDLHTLIHDHCQRVIDNMNHDDLIAYAKDQMVSSFIYGGYVRNDNVQEDLLNDMMLHEEGDSDSVYEFMVGAGIDEDLAEQVINQFMS